MPNEMNMKPTVSSPAHVSLNAQTYKLGELFSGAGGMALGAHQAQISGGGGYRHIWVNDRDKDACDTLSHNLPIDPDMVLCGDVRDIKFNQLPTIDGLVFGFPCNDFSVVGDRHGISGHYGALYQYGIKALNALKPLFFVAENVSGLASSGNDLGIILNAMEHAGYKIFPETYKFDYYGVPQKRRRIIIIGFRNDIDIADFAPPAPITKNKPVSCRTALKDIRAGTPNNELTQQSAKVVERLKHIRPGENAFTANLPDRLKLSMKSGATISQIYKRLKPDEPSYTVTGSGGGGTHIYHWEENRALTNRERARLQSFPDSFVFLGGKESVRRQIGMAVPPEGARHIFRAILKTLIKGNIQSQC